jgi:DNA-binding NarL/FixJ family response regulator
MITIKIGLVDDHQLFLKSLGLMLESFKTFEIVVEALNGKDLQEKMNIGLLPIPDVMLIDVDMPVMNGKQTAEWLNTNYPTIKLVALSMKDDDKTIIEMLKAGCCSYILKDIHPTELEKALLEVHTKGYYNSDITNINYRRLLTAEKEVYISETEKQFLQYACSDMTYKSIAIAMKVTERSIDAYRETLFHKLKVQSRVGLALEAIRKGLASL